jgi:Tfp pilus assembly protein PilX
MLNDERGIALIMALGIMLVLTITLTSVIFLTAATARDSKRTNAGQTAYALAEAGVNDAFAVLNTDYANPLTFYPGNNCLLHPQAAASFYAGYTATDATSCGSLAAFNTAYDTGNCSAPVNSCVTWSGALQSVTGLGWDYQWVIRATGSVRNPTGPSTANVTRTVTVKVPVLQGDTKVGSDSILEWVYAKGDLVFSNSVGVSAPVYAGGNLDLQSSAVICGTAGKAVANGNFLLENPQNQAGQIADTGKCPLVPPAASDPKLPEVHIVGNPANQACHYKSGGSAVINASPCTAANNVFATIADNTIPAGLLALASTAPDPVAGLAAAKPGPNHLCNSNAPSGLNPTFSFAAGGNPLATPTNPINLTPATSYSCKFLIGSQPIGELSWDVSRKLLTVLGTIYIDASAQVTANALYQGRAILFLSGIFLMNANGENLCAVKTSAGTDCDLAAGKWDPNVNVLVIDAQGDDGSGNGIHLKNKVQYQGGLVAKNEINLETNAIAQGPMDSTNSTVTAGQSNNISFPAIKLLPGGSLGSNVPGKLLLPREYRGG